MADVGIILITSYIDEETEIRNVSRCPGVTQLGYTKAPSYFLIFNVLILREREREREVEREREISIHCSTY